MKYFINWLIAFILSGNVFSQPKINTNTADRPPNIIIILADDMGFSDLGCMGSQIHTPAIDKLAKEGISFSNFYNTGRCCPSRASLLTGKYAHKVGMGWMTVANLGKSGYTGDLDTKSETIAEALNKLNYRCYMSGKWHVTADKYINDTASKHNWPLQRGFQQYFGILGGGDNYFIPKNLTSNNHIIPPPDNFYLTKAISDSAIEFMQEHINNYRSSPFFCYVAFTTPHRPLQALRSDINKYKNVFKDGWDSLRMQKSNYLMQQGWISKGTALTVKDKNIPDWFDVTEDEKATWQARMEVYAAQIDNMDQGIGRIIEMLKKNNQLENTLILFLSDNGGNDEMEGNEAAMPVAEIDQLGDVTPRHSYHQEWAQVSNAPFRSYKANIYEGGIATPLIAHWPAYIKTKGLITTQVGHIVDIMPTIIAAAGISLPQKSVLAGYDKTDGVNLLSCLKGKKINRHAIYFEHESACGIRLGNWKLVSSKSKNAPYAPHWELYDLKNDRAENNNLADKYPAIAKQLANKWIRWAKAAKVYPLDGRQWGERVTL